MTPTSRRHGDVGQPGIGLASEQAGFAPTLLIVVSDAALRSLLVSIVGGLGFAVRSGPAGDQGAVSEMDDIPDAALVHAGLNDWAPVAHLARQCKIILLTPDAKPAAAEDLGVFCVVPMPFDLDDLESALERCLRELAGGMQVR